MLRRIVKVLPMPDRVLRLEYADGSWVEVDFGPTIKRGGVFQALDRKDIFMAAAVAPNGRSIVWPGELDFCADALWMAGNSASLADERASA